jgi:hypothetical protein
MVMSYLWDAEESDLCLPQPASAYITRCAALVSDNVTPYCLATVCQ